MLVEDPKRSYGRVSDESSRLIWGDNLAAMKTLAPDLSEKIRCIYVDPPYNTGNDFGDYQDSVDHDEWLSEMRARFEQMRALLRPDGVLFVQLDDEECAYCKVLLDEIFGRKNFLNQIAVMVKRVAGASGGGEDRRLKKNLEYILIYTKDAAKFQRFNPIFEESDLLSHIQGMESAGRSWKYVSVLGDEGKAVEHRTLRDGSGGRIEVARHAGVRRTTVAALTKRAPIDAVYRTHLARIFADTNAQSSIRTRIIDSFGQLGRDEMLVARYTPRSGRSRGEQVVHHYVSPSIRRVIWLSAITTERGGRLIKREQLGTFWNGFDWNNVSKEGAVTFPGKKPEALLARIIRLATDENDWVLDAFGGSGTTAAVAHKLRRRFILIERGRQAITHALPRLRRVIDGTDVNGITAEVGWRGGGGFRFFASR